MHVSLDPVHIVLGLDGDPAPPPPKGAEPPIFGPYLLWPNGWMDQDATLYGGRPHGLRDIVLDGDRARRGSWVPNFWPMSVVAMQTAGWTQMPLGMEIGLDPGDCV